MVKLWNGFWTAADVQRNEQDIFVFGDNDIRRGRGGQAVIRYCPNSVGIRTKRLPSMAQGSFYSDKKCELHNILDDFIVVAKLNLNHTVWFPANGFGTGRAQLSYYAPLCAALIEQCTGILLNEEPATALSMIQDIEI